MSPETAIAGYIRLFKQRALGTIFAAALVLAADPAIAMIDSPKSLADQQHSTGAPAEQGLSDAQAALDRGDYQQAEFILRPLCLRQPKNFESNEALGLLYASQSRFREALHFLAIAVAVKPGSPVGHANLGIALLKTDHAPQAAKELELAAHLDPGNIHTQEAWGESLMLLGEWQSAIAPLKAAMQGGASDPDLPYDFALALFNQGDAAQALPIIQNARNLSHSAPAQSLLGDIQEKLGNYKESAEHYIAAAQIEPSESNIYALGMELLRHWTFDPAVAEFTMGAQKFPESERMRLGLGLAYYANQNYDHAIATVSEIVSTDPANSLAAELLGRSCTALAEGSNPGCTILLSAATIHPKDASLATYAAASLLVKTPSSTDLERAGELLHHALSQNPKSAEAHLELGILLQLQSSWKESISPLEEALREKPGDAKAHYRLSRAYQHEGRSADAKKQVALYQQFSSAQQKDLNGRLKEITTLVVTMAPVR